MSCLEGKDAARLLRESGLLVDINRRILHPLGLALSITATQNDDGSVEYGDEFGLQDCRNDPEGMVYDRGSIRKAEEKLAEYGVEAIHQARLRALGYVVQPVGDSDVAP